MPDPVSPTAPFTITLEAQQWNGVISALIKAPYELAAPLIQSITTQLQQQQQESGQAPANGAGQPIVTPPVVPPIN